MAARMSGAIPAALSLAKFMRSPSSIGCSATYAGAGAGRKPVPLSKRRQWRRSAARCLQIVRAGFLGRR
jgi:hypothetical protein